MDKQYRIERKQAKDGKFHFLVIVDDEYGYYVYDQNTVNNFCGYNGQDAALWPVGDDPWDAFDESEYREDMPKVEPERVMTSSYEEVCNYLKINALIGTVK